MVLFSPTPPNRGSTEDFFPAPIHILHVYAHTHRDTHPHMQTMKPGQVFHNMYWSYLGTFTNLISIIRVDHYKAYFSTAAVAT